MQMTPHPTPPDAGHWVRSLCLSVASRWAGAGLYVAPGWEVTLGAMSRGHQAAPGSQRPFPNHPQDQPPSAPWCPGPDTSCDLEPRAQVAGRTTCSVLCLLLGVRPGACSVSPVTSGPPVGSPQTLRVSLYTAPSQLRGRTEGMSGTRIPLNQGQVRTVMTPWMQLYTP